MRKTFKILGYIFGSILVLLLIVVLYLQTSWGKELVRKKLVQFLEEKFKTEVVIDKIKYRIPRSIGFEGLILIDQQKDTLLAVGDLDVKINMLSLIGSKVEINELNLENVNGNIYRSIPDSTFNFNYIIDAFSSEVEDGPKQEVEVEDTTGSKLVFDVKKVGLKNIRFKFNDSSGGTFFALNLEELLLRPTAIDLNENSFEVNDLLVKGLQSTFVVDTSYLVKVEDTASSDFKLKVRQIQLENIQFAMLDKTDSMSMDYDIGFLKTELKYFGLVEELVRLGELQLDETQGKIVIGKTQNKSVEDKDNEDSTGSNWDVTASNIALNKINFAFDDNNEIRQKSGMDYGHLNINDLYFNMEDVVYKTDTISGNLKHLALQEQSGLQIMELRSKIQYHNQGAVLEDLYLLTPHTLLQDKIVVSYDSLGSLDKEMGKMELAIDLNKCKVGIFDLLLFLPPDQQQQFLPYKNQSLVLNVNMKGPLESLLIDKFQIVGLQGTLIDLKGRLRGLPDADNLFYDLDLTTVRTTAKDINPFLPDSLKQQILLPEWMNIHGKLKGGVEDYFPNVLIQTSDGDARVNGFLSMSKGTDREEYDLMISTEKLNLGKILRQADSVLGMVTFEANAQGRGFDPAKMRAKFDAKILSAWALGYPYSNIEFNGEIEESKAVFNGFSEDPNVDFVLKGSADFQEEYPGIYADLKMKYIDLFALQLTDDTMNFSGQLMADFDSVNPDYPFGNLLFTDGRLQMPGNNAFLDTLIFVSKPTEDSSQNIYLNASNLVHASLNGKIPLTKIGTALTSHIDRHYFLNDTSIKEGDYQYDMELNAFVNYHPLLKNLVPELQPFDTIKIIASMDAENLDLKASIPSLIYGGNNLDSGFVSIKENKDTFNYSLGLKRYFTESIELFYPSVKGLIRNDSIYTVVNIKDSADENQFTLGGSLYQDRSHDSSLTYVKLFKGLRFDYNIWDVNPNNQIVLTPEGFYIQDFEISKAAEKIIIKSQAPQPQSPLDILIQNFELANITSMISKDTLLAEGKLNVDGNLDLSDSFPKVDLNLSILDLKAFEQPVGELKLLAKNENDNDYKANLTLTGYGNNVNLDGYYYLKPVRRNNFDFQLDIQPLSLKSLEGLTFGAIRNSSGGLLGNLNIQGTVERPKITGNLDFLKLTTTVAALNAPFTFPDERITFSTNTISFDNFKIQDSKGKSATIDGKIRTRDYLEYFSDLTFKANKWQPIQSTKKDNPEFYGNLILSANLGIKGLITAPQVDGSLTIHDSTDFTYAMIDSGPGIVEHEGIVKFIDSRDTNYVDSSQIIASRRRISKSSELNVNVDIEKSAKISVLMDPATGDMLQVQGKADLNTFLAPDGSIGLTGNYELEDGFYELHYNFLVRKFKIQKGSLITLSGDPLDAEADITAVYEANIAPYDLVEKQATPEQLVYYKQRLPFEVLLKIKGPAMKPEITFDISLPEEKANTVSTEVSNLVQAKLSEMRTNPSEMNKQVFAVLILGRFIAEDPFSSGAGGGMEYAVRQSVSRFLSDQLNSITEGLIEGFEINLDLESSEDYSTGTKQNKTDLNVSASKRLLNDRLKVTVGNNFELEGQSAQKNSSVIPGDISIDYELSRDGKYQIRAYRSNELRNIVDGYTVETGVNFRVALEYNRFKYIFINRKKFMKNLRERRAEQMKESNENEDNGEENENEVSLNK